MSSSSTAPMNREFRKRTFESMLEAASPHVALHSLVLPWETGAMKQISRLRRSACQTPFLRQFLWPCPFQWRTYLRLMSVNL